MKITFTENTWQQFNYWLENDLDHVNKIKDLIKSIQRTPFHGLGRPEQLKHQLKGYWSRRINQEHRLVFAISGKTGMDQTCTIIQCRFHYR